MTVDFFLRHIYIYIYINNFFKHTIQYMFLVTVSSFINKENQRISDIQNLFNNSNDNIIFKENHMSR